MTGYTHRLQRKEILPLFHLTAHPHCGGLLVCIKTECAFAAQFVAQVETSLSPQFVSVHRRECKIGGSDTSLAVR